MAEEEGKVDPEMLCLKLKDPGDASGEAGTWPVNKTKVDSLSHQVVGGKIDKTRRISQKQTGNYLKKR